MTIATFAAPSSTATVFCCPECAGAARLRLVEPDERRSGREWHTFECRDCGQHRAYLIDNVC
jgi:predicted RNA-binding Zn-ribbon protein involved in translation (DUF1610 family)